jgi:hypothetical protein
VVGIGRDDSNRVLVLVGCLPQRLVLTFDSLPPAERLCEFHSTENLQICGASLIITGLFGDVKSFCTIPSKFWRRCCSMAPRQLQF